MGNILDGFLEIVAKTLTSAVTPPGTAIAFTRPAAEPEISNWIFWLVIAWLIVSDLRNFAKWCKKEGLAGGIDYLWSIVLIQAGAVLIFWYMPLWIDRSSTWTILSAEVIRWVFLYLGSIGVYFGTRKHGGRRGLMAYLVVLSIFLLGWSFGRWFGILLVAVPLLLALGFSLYQLAIAIVPAADPDAPFLNLGEVKRISGTLLSRLLNPSAQEASPSNQKSIGELFREFASAIRKTPGEKFKRFQILFWYLCGLQYPLIVISDTTGRQMEVRISGSPFKKIGAPGMIWCRSNQVVGLTDGPNFARVGGPGPVFTEHFERALQLMDLARSASEPELMGCVDLRTQLRSTVIEAVSKDGHSFQAVLFIAFCIDAQKEWPRAEHHRLQKANTILEAGRVCDRGTEAYPYNAARVQAALSTTAIDDSVSSGMKAIHWDQWVLSRMCEAAQEVLSQRNLDELWRPRGNGPGKNTLDEIGGELKTRMAPRMQEFGIQLAAARVVNYLIPEDHPVVKQQIATWSAAWEKRAHELLADGQAQAERLELEAKAYARYMFLTMVAEGLEKAKGVNKDLPKHVVAMRTIAAMEELLRQRPDASSAEAAGHVAAIRQRMLPRS
jgi:hypothetical protein